jgi:hypothetical protein
VLGLILAQQRHYAEAARQIRSYLEYAPDAKDAARAQAQLRRVERLAAAARR